MRALAAPMLPVALTLFMLVGLAPDPAAALSPVHGTSVSGVVCVAQDVVYMAEPMDRDGIRAPSNEEVMPYCSGVGIPGAKVELSGPATYSATTQEGGRFEVSAPTGDYTLTVTRTGFDAARLPLQVAGPTNQDLSLRPQRQDVTGRITRADGTPVPAADVNLCCSGDSLYQSTDADGRFKGTLPSGMYSFNVRAPGHRVHDSQAFIDGTTTLDAVLEPLPPMDARIVGTVSDQTGTPVVGITVIMDQWECCRKSVEPMAPDVRGAPTQGIPMRVQAMPECYGCTSKGTQVDHRAETVTDAAGRYELAAYGGGTANLRVDHPGFSSFYASVEPQADQTTNFDIRIVRMPARSAHVQGWLVDAETGAHLRAGWISAESPTVGRSECSERVEPGMMASPWPVAPPHASGYPGGYPSPAYPSPITWTASASPATVVQYSGVGSAEGMVNMMSVPMDGILSAGYQGCALRIFPDGSFDGYLTPGFTVLSATVDNACHESQDADGTFHRQCGREYMRFVLSLALVDGDNPEILLPLQARPAPDAVVSGYIVDAATGKAIPYARIEFTNEQQQGYAYAQADHDGSYRVRLRHGYHTLNVNLDGYFSWQGTLQVPAGETPFDVTVTPGRPMGCCGGWEKPHWGGDIDMGIPDMPYPMVAPQSAPEAVMPGSGGMDRTAMRVESASQGDLGGGLGPYDPEERHAVLAGETQDNPSARLAPAASVAFMALALAGLVLLRRRD